MSLGTIAAIPIVGWMISIILSVCIAIPYYILWHWFNVKKFFMFLPDVYVNMGFWDMVGLFIVIGFIKSICLPTISVSNTTSDKK